MAADPAVPGGLPAGATADGGAVVTVRAEALAVASAAHVR
jgi:hypothetical protein